MPTDEQIKKDIVDELVWDGRVDASEVKVEVEKGIVTLSGTAPTYRARDAAAEDAWSILGVHDVSNLITVSPPLEYVIPEDDEIAKNILNILMVNPNIDSADITAVVTNGKVVLRGSVPSYWQKLQAEDAVSNIGGVTEITNELAVVPTGSRTDEEIAQDIVDAIDRDIHIDVDEVTIEVDNGIVTLTGGVPDRLAYNALMNVAEHTLGVIDVHDHLVMTYTGYPWNEG